MQLNFVYSQIQENWEEEVFHFQYQEKVKISKLGKQESMCEPPIIGCEPQITKGTQVKQKTRLNTKVDMNSKNHQAFLPL